MSCIDCITAEKNPRSGLYQSHCKECSARSIANSPAFFDSARADAMTPTYRSALQYVFGAEWQEGHQRVKAWSEKIKGTA